jgi:hypothetical protein
VLRAARACRAIGAKNARYSKRTEARAYQHFAKGGSLLQVSVLLFEVCIGRLQRLHQPSPFHLLRLITIILLFLCSSFIIFFLVSCSGAGIEKCDL